jgi:hypothetical protein
MLACRQMDSVAILLGDDGTVAVLGFSVLEGDEHPAQVIAPGQHRICCTDRERKRLCSPIADHMERKRTADHAHGFGPPSSHN